MSNVSFKSISVLGSHRYNPQNTVRRVQTPLILEYQYLSEALGSPAILLLAYGTATKSKKEFDQNCGSIFKY